MTAASATTSSSPTTSCWPAIATVGDFAILGGGAAVIQFARVGAHAFLGGMSGLENDLIPYGMALGNRAYLSGLNIVGLQRRGFSRERDPRPAPRLPAAVRRRGHADRSASRTSRRSSPTTRSCRRSSRSSAPAASAACARRKKRPRLEAADVAQALHVGYARVVGILAGGGSLPREIAEHVAARGGAVHIVALAGAADADLGDFPLDPGPLGADRRHGARSCATPAVTELVIVGSVRRPDLGEDQARPRLLAQLAGHRAHRRLRGGDDGVLQPRRALLRKQGLQGRLADRRARRSCWCGEGPLGACEAGSAPRCDDRARLRRRARARRFRRRAGGGRRRRAHRGRRRRRRHGRHAGAGRPCSAGCPSGGAADARRARQASQAAPGDARRPAGHRSRHGRSARSRRALPASPCWPAPSRSIAPSWCAAPMPAACSCRASLDRGTAIAAAAPAAYATPFVTVGVPSRRETPANRRMRRAAPRCCSVLEPRDRAAVIDRGHVLAIECGEGIAALIARSGSLRHWGRRRWARRSAVAVVSEAVAADLAAVISSAAAAHLAGIAVVGAHAGRAGARHDARRPQRAVPDRRAVGGTP